MEKVYLRGVFGGLGLAMFSLEVWLACGGANATNFILLPIPFTCFNFTTLDRPVIPST